VQLGIGQFFGEIAVLLLARRSATVTAITRTNLLVLNAADFHLLMEEQPRIAARVHAVVRERVGREIVSPRGDIVAEELRGAQESAPTSPSDDGTCHSAKMRQKRSKDGHAGYPAERFPARGVLPVPAAVSFDPGPLKRSAASGHPRSLPRARCPFSSCPPSEAARAAGNVLVPQRHAASAGLALNVTLIIRATGLLSLARRAPERAIDIGLPLGQLHPNFRSRELGIGSRTALAQPCRWTAGFAAQFPEFYSFSQDISSGYQDFTQRLRKN
jgi:hypothetical protein